VSADHRARILVADDHQPLRDRVVAILADEFSVVGTVTDGAQLVAAEAALHPDVLVVDIWMPGMSGLEATAQIRDRGSHVPVVCLTGYSVSDMQDAAWDAGATAYVLKTSLARDLLPAVRAALDGRRFVSECVAPDRSPAR
jgi:DNA-binding NarL/FixJ family response regulator